MLNANFLALIVFENSAFVRTDGHDFTLWGQKCFLLPVTHFPTNLLYHFTLRLTGVQFISKHFKDFIL